MQAKSNSLALSATLGVRVTDSERSVFAERAEGAGLSLSEWCRQAILGSVSTSPDTRLLLAEIIAARKLTLWSLVQVSKSKPLDRIHDQITEANAVKFAAAEECIAQYFIQAAEHDAEDSENDAEESEDDAEETDEDDAA